MKIESLHIENFGKLSNFDLKLNSGLNVFKEDNGWGKSTLTVFIRVMFYGFEGEGKHGVIANERNRFTPWQGGVFGGNLVFETKGRRYLITRIFGAKKAEDFFELRDADTNLLSDSFSSEIGKELFHINSESFMKTIFIGQNDCAASDSTDDINSRIGNISDTTDMNKYKTADSLLGQAVLRLSTKKNSAQWKHKERITELKTKLNAAQGIESVLDEINKRLEKEETEIDNIKKEQLILNERKAKSTGMAELLAAKKEYAALTQELKEKRENCEKEKDWFPKDVPTADRLALWERCQDNMNMAESAAESVAVSEEEQEEFNALSERFSKGIPDEVVNGAMKDKANELYRLRSNASATPLTEEENEKRAVYLKKFRDYGDFKRELGYIRDDYEHKYIPNNAKLSSMVEETGRLQDTLILAKRRSIASLVVGFIFSFLFILSGAMVRVPAVKDKFLKDFTAEILMLISVGLIVIGVLILLIMLIMKLFNGNLKDTSDMVNLKKGEILSLRTLIEEEEERFSFFFKRYNYALRDNDYSEGFKILADENEEFHYLDDKYFKFKENDKTDECNILSTRICDYLSLYGVEAEEHEYSARLADLSADARRYSYLEGKISKAQEYKKHSSLSVQEFKEQLTVFGFDTECDLNLLFEGIREHIAAYSEASRLLSDVIMRINRFEASHDCEAIKAPVSSEDIVSSEELNELQKELDARREHVEQAKRIDLDNLESYKDQYEDYLENLAEYEEEQLLLEKTAVKYDLISKAQAFLLTAKENMTSKYVDPLKKGFDKYYGFISGENTQDYNLDANLVLTKLEKGVQRDKASLSHGYRDLIGFCMRLSMADTMYKNEKPLLVLDDPFVNLDDEKVNAAAELLKKTSESYQIIYMTCREDRLANTVVNEQ